MAYNSKYTGLQVEELLKKAGTALQAHQSLDGKVDKVDGKGLSTNDYTTAEKTKLGGIAEGANVNVQADWNATEGDAFIKNKPQFIALADVEEGNDGFASAYDVKVVIDENEETTAAALNDLEAKIQEVSGKTLTASDIPSLEIGKISGLQDALDGKQNSLSFMSTPSGTNKVATKSDIDAAVAGASNYLGTVSSAAGLSSNAKKGDFYRISAVWDSTTQHIGDILIAEKDNPSTNIDGSNWTLLHNELNTDTTYTFTGGTNGFSVTPLNGTAQTVSVAVTTVNGHTVNADVPSGAKFTDTVYTHPDTHAASMITGLATVATSGSYNDLSNKPTSLPANGGNAATVNNHTVNADVPSGAKFTDTTYESKTAANGGTDVSLVTTGEKYTWNNKQNAISDLATIRSGASAGATAVQPAAISDMETKTHASQTYQPKGSYLTSHQDISGKENTSNKVTAWSSTLTDAHYPSEKLVKQTIDNLNKTISELLAQVEALEAKVNENERGTAASLNELNSRYNSLSEQIN